MFIKLCILHRQTAVNREIFVVSCYAFSLFLGYYILFLADSLQLSGRKCRLAHISACGSICCFLHIKTAFKVIIFNKSVFLLCFQIIGIIRGFGSRIQIVHQQRYIIAVAVYYHGSVQVVNELETTFFVFLNQLEVHVVLQIHCGTSADTSPAKYHGILYKVIPFTSKLFYQLYT